MQPVYLTALVGALGIFATIGVSIFTQVYQGRLQTDRDKRAAAERRGERLEQERHTAYRRYLENLTREQTLYRGLGTDDYSERRRAQSDAVWSGLPTLVDVLLIAPERVRVAIQEHDRCTADSAGAWHDYHHRPTDDPERPASLERLRQANRAKGVARQALEDAIRAEMGIVD